MPQDSLRSVVYRSFVTCDDPKGVVDCGTIRKSKTSSQKMEHKIESRRTPKNLNTSSANKEKNKVGSMGIVGDLHNPSSFQLSEVSRGAQKLNQTIDSWSKGLSFDGQSKDIAKDLLRGALDLQESLIMLGKLQEASRYMAKLKKKQKEKAEIGRVDEEGIERTNSNRFGDQNYQMGFQKPRLSADGSSRNSVDELKKVIRDSLARQNLLSNTTTDEKAFDDRRKLDSASDIPSTSSSGSSLIHSNNSGSTDSSFLSAAPQKKAKGSNLIAKLMGLEEVTSRPLQTTPQKQLESEKISNQQKPIFDIDMPKVKKPQFVAQKIDSERKLKQILETMQFKGLLKSNSVERHKLHTYRSSTSHSKQRFIDDIPPIVIIKPLNFPCLEAEEPVTSKIIRRDGALGTRELLRKLKVKEELPPTSIDFKKGASNSNGIHEELEAEETPSKRLSQGGGDKSSKVVARKQGGQEVKTKEKVSYKGKASVPANCKPQKKEGIDKKAENIHKAAAIGRKPVEENVKLKNVSKSQDVKVTSTKPRKPENKPNVTKNQSPRQQSATPNAVSKRTALTIIHTSTDRKKNQIKKEKPVKEAPEANLATENLGCKDDDKISNLLSENVSVLNRTSSTLSDQLPAEEETGASEIEIGEHCSDVQSSICEVTPLTTQPERGTKSNEEANDGIGDSRTQSKSFKTRTNLHYLLLSSESFLNHAEELFDININQPKNLPSSSINDFGVAHVRLSLDCANELMECKSLRESQLVLPLLQTQVRNSKFCISLDHLVEEICDGIENLRRYSKLASENLHIENIYAMLERDLKHKEIVTGMWDLGWRNGFSVDEVDRVMADIEKLVLGGLIEDVLTDFLL